MFFFIYWKFWKKLQKIFSDIQKIFNRKFVFISKNLFFYCVKHDFLKFLSDLKDNCSDHPLKFCKIPNNSIYSWNSTIIPIWALQYPFFPNCAAPETEHLPSISCQWSAHFPETLSLFSAPLRLRLCVPHTVSCAQTSECSARRPGGQTAFFPRGKRHSARQPDATKHKHRREGGENGTGGGAQAFLTSPHWPWALFFLPFCRIFELL